MIAAAGGGLPGPGYTFICDESVAAALWKALAVLVSVVAAGWSVGSELGVRHVCLFVYRGGRCGGERFFLSAESLTGQLRESVLLIAL